MEVGSLVVGAWVVLLVLGIAMVMAQLRLFHISDTLDKILEELRRRPQ